MGLGTVRKLNRRIWTNAGTAGRIGVNPVQAKKPRTDDGTRSVQALERRLKKQGAGTEASISRNGTTTLGESRWGTRVDC